MEIVRKLKIIIIFLLLIKIQAQENNIQHFTIDHELSSNVINDISQDKIGYLWIATNNGLLKFDGIKFYEINTLKTNCLTINKNIVYAGLDNGLFVKNNSKELFYDSKKVIKIKVFNNTIIVATEQGIYKLTENYLQPLKINTEIDFSIINDILFTNNFYYVATNKGLWKLNKLNHPNKIDKIITTNISSLIKFNTKIIAASTNDGLYILDKDLKINNIKTSNNSTSVKKIDNEIWLSSSLNGIEIYSLPSFTFKQKINKYNSLKTNAVFTVFNDKQNTKWIASNNGLYQIKKNQSKKSISKKPIVYFEEILINHKSIDSVLSLKKNLLFSPEENNISIKYKTVNLKKPNKINYRYRLNNNFSNWSANNIIQFPNLNPGVYNLEIQSKIYNNLSKIKSISFTIDKPFYKKTWFIMISFISFLFVCYVLVDFYIKKNKKISNDRISALKQENHLLTLEQKALQLQMNPHFIFNVLNGIKALGNTGKIDELNKTISQFSVLLRSILNNSRKEEISLQEEIDYLKNYIELEQNMSSKLFTFQIHTNLNNIDPEEILIPSMLIQPFIENCIKHGIQLNKEGKIDVNFDVIHNFLNCTIIDNGIGFNQSKKENQNHSSIAIKVSKERIEKISTKNSFLINEVVEATKIKGTKVWFKIPLKTDY